MTLRIVKDSSSSDRLLCLINSLQVNRILIYETSLGPLQIKPFLSGIQGLFVLV